MTVVDLLNALMGVDLLFDAFEGVEGLVSGGSRAVLLSEFDKGANRVREVGWDVSEIAVDILNGILKVRRFECRLRWVILWLRSVGYAGELVRG